MNKDLRMSSRVASTCWIPQTPAGLDTCVWHVVHARSRRPRQHASCTTGAQETKSVRHVRRRCQRTLLKRATRGACTTRTNERWHRAPLRFLSPLFESEHVAYLQTIEQTTNSPETPSHSSCLCIRHQPDHPGRPRKPTSKNLNETQ